MVNAGKVADNFLQSLFFILYFANRSGRVKWLPPNFWVNGIAPANLPTHLYDTKFRKRKWAVGRSWRQEPKVTVAFFFAFFFLRQATYSHSTDVAY